MIARDIMQTRFHTLSPGDTIAEAVKCFQSASASEKKKIFGLMVTDDSDHLVGMLSMYDILLFIQPKHIQIWGEMDDLDPSVLYDERLEQVKSILVGDIMTAEVVTIAAHTHLMVIADIMIKYKINSVLLTDEKLRPGGMVSKTDIMSAFYAGFPTHTPVESIRVGPLLYCYPDDELESSLDIMHLNGVHRLYVLGAKADEVAGVIAYPDIVGLLYRYCRACDKGLLKTRRRRTEDDYRRLKVQDVMTSAVTAYHDEEALVTIIEGLTEHRCGAVLITNAENKAAGVVSKSDLIVAYKHGLAVDVRARNVMSTPVRSCPAETELSDAIQLMLLKDVQRIFIHADDPTKIVGVLSLSDAARFRSGSCRACTSSQLMRL